MEGAEFSAVPGAEEGDNEAFDVGDDAAEGVRGDNGLDVLAEAEVVVALVEEEGPGADQPLLARGIRRLEEVRLRHQHELGGLRARQHHTGAAQQVRLEDLTVPACMHASIAWFRNKQFRC